MDSAHELLRYFLVATLAAGTTGLDGKWCSLVVSYLSSLYLLHCPLIIEKAPSTLELEY